MARAFLATALMTAVSTLALMTPGNVLAATTSYDVVSDVRIPMPDGVLLDSDEYIPTTGCPCPTILVQTPYRKSGAGVSEGNTIFPSNGYAMIVVDVRGTGSSRSDRRRCQLDTTCSRLIVSPFK